MVRSLSFFMVRMAGLAVASAVFGAVASACSSDNASGQACSPGDSQSCKCSDGPSGLARCNASGSGYGACVCGDAAPSGGTGGASNTDGGNKQSDGVAGGLAFLASCTTNADCQSNNCYPFNAKGPHCTKACASDGDCPAPSPGCSMVGVCKAP